HDKNWVWILQKLIEKHKIHLIPEYSYEAFQKK
mgnify:CR=1